MNTSTITATSSTSVYTTPAFWERLWRSGGIQAVGLFIIAYLVYGYQPSVGAPADALIAFYDGERTRILVAAILSGFAVLNLMWFAAALRATLAEAEQDGWGGRGDRRERSARRIVSPDPRDDRGARVLDRRLRESRAHIGAQ